MRHTSKRKTRRTIGIRGQLLWFLCFICLLLLLLFWFLSTRLLEPLYTTHIQKQLTAQADAIVERLDQAIAEGETLSYWGFGSQLYVNTTFFNELGSEIFENSGMSSFCVDISDTTLRQIFKIENLSYCNLHRTKPTDTGGEMLSYSTARAMRQLCRETGSCVRKINPPTPSGSVQLMVGKTTSDGSYTVLVTTSLMHVAEAGRVMSTVLPLAAALIFAFSMSAAWLFSEWFTKPLRELSGAARGSELDQFAEPFGQGRVVDAAGRDRRVPFLEFAVVSFAGKHEVRAGFPAQFERDRGGSLRDDIVVADHGIGSGERFLFALEQLADQLEFAEHVQISHIARHEDRAGSVRMGGQRPLEALKLHFGVVTVVVRPQRPDVAARHEDEVPSAGPVEVFEQQFDLPVVPPVQEIVLLLHAGEIAVAAEAFGRIDLDHRQVAPGE